MNPRSFSLFDTLERNARAHASRIALVGEQGESLTFAELAERTARLAGGLASLGLSRGDRIAILAYNSARYLELFLACAHQGFVAYPLNWRLKPEELDRILDRAQARVLLVDTSTAETATALAPRDLRRLALDDAGLDGYEPLAPLYERPPAVRPALSADEPFAVIATAAVDIVPRGAVLSHGNLLASNVQEIAALGLGPEDGNLLALPLFHIAGLGHALSFLHVGAKNVVMSRFDADAAVALIDRHQLTHLSDFPPVLAQLLDAARNAGTSLPSLRHVTGLDAPETMERLHRETEATFWTGFGQCETSGFVTLQNAREQLGCAGRPAELCQVRLVGDDEREVAVGEPGEITVRGPVVFLGYDGQPDVSEYTFRGGWHHTGDLGRFDEEGRLYYVARKPEKELIKPGGENVYPAEVEATILELDGVEACCVFGVPDATWGEAIKAVVAVRPNAPSLTETAVIEHVAGRIARYKKPKHVVLVDELPRTEDGTIDRSAVKERYK